MISLGDKVKDTVTGFLGIVVGTTRWLNGSVSCGVQADYLDEADLPGQIIWIDEHQLDLVVAGKVRRGPRNTSTGAVISKATPKPIP